MGRYRWASVLYYLGAILLGQSAAIVSQTPALIAAQPMKPWYTILFFAVLKKIAKKDGHVDVLQFLISRESITVPHWNFSVTA